MHCIDKHAHRVGLKTQQRFYPVSLSLSMTQAVSIVLRFVMLSVTTLSVMILRFCCIYAECPYVAYNYAECPYANYNYDIYRCQVMLCQLSYLVCP